MKKNELTQMRSKTLEELRKLIDTNKLELISFVTKDSAKAGKNVKKAKNLRLNIAQLSTLVREKEIITAFKKTPTLRVGDELNADMSSSLEETPRLQRGEDVIEAEKNSEKGKK